MDNSERDIQAMLVKQGRLEEKIDNLTSTVNDMKKNSADTQELKMEIVNIKGTIKILAWVAAIIGTTTAGLLVRLISVYIFKV